jgi:ribosomal protein S18 acetylase RimI-like enzyme
MTENDKIRPVLISNKNLSYFKDLLIDIHLESGNDSSLVSSELMNQYLRQINRHMLIVVGAANANRLIGYGALQRRLRGKEKLAFVLLSVLSAHWSKGVGTLLMHHLIRVATQLREPQLLLEVAEDNHRARRLYERLGFAYTEPFTVSGARTMPHTVMRLDLSSSLAQP